MITNVSFQDFTQSFVDRGRDYFSYNGYKALYNYLIELEEDIGTIELDVIAIVSDYTEYKSLEEFNDDYFGNQDEYDSISDLSHDTTVIVFEGGLIVQAF